MFVLNCHVFGGDPSDVDTDNETVPVVGVSPRPGAGVVVDRCTSIFGFAFWTVVGFEVCPDLPCCDTVPPQFPLLIMLSLVFELDTGFKQELLIEAAWLRLPLVCL